MNCINCNKKLGDHEIKYNIKTCYYCDSYKYNKFIIIKYKKPVEYLKRLFNIGINYN